MFRQTRREGDGWRFDWEDDRGNVFLGLRYYPKIELVSTWSRKPHKMAKVKFHPYVINGHDFKHIGYACKERWGIKPQKG